jgi:hypothetical protein
MKDFFTVPRIQEDYWVLKNHSRSDLSQLDHLLLPAAR